MSRTLALSLALAAAPYLTAQAPGSDWRFAHPKPDILLSVNVGTLTHSLVLGQMIHQSVPGPNRAVADMALKTLATVDRVQVSLRLPPGGTGDPDALILITGDLDPNIRQMLLQSSKGAVAHQLGPKAILMGNAATVEQAVRRIAQPAASSFADRLAGNDIWISGDMAQMAVLAKTPLPPALDGLKRFSLGINLGTNVELNSILSMTDAAGAGKLLAIYNMAVAMAPQTPENSKLVQAAKAEQDGATLRFRFSAPAAELQAGLAKAQGGGQLPGLLGTVFGPSKEDGVPVPKPAPKPGKIMIYGLDDGPHEVGAH